MELGDINAKLINQYKFKYQVTFLLLFNKNGEDGEITNQIEFPIIISMTGNLTHSELNNNNINQWTLENRIQTKEIKKLGRTFKEKTK